MPIIITLCSQPLYSQAWTAREGNSIRNNNKFCIIIAKNIIFRMAEILFTVSYNGTVIWNRYRKNYLFLPCGKWFIDIKKS